jgi:hypothetical protein
MDRDTVLYPLAKNSLEVEGRHIEVNTTCTRLLQDVELVQCSVKKMKVEINVVHRAGSANGNADALSRADLCMILKELCIL